MAEGREVDAEAWDGPRSFAGRPGASCRSGEKADQLCDRMSIMIFTIEGSWRRDGLGPSASMPDLAGVVPATRGLTAAPWTPASLSLLPLRKALETRQVGS